MDMTLRWYGEGNDSVTLDQIRQIPGVTGVITALHDIPAGEAWTYEDVMKRKQEVEAKGLKLVGVESINVHEDIKIGLPTRDELIENYCKSLEAIGKADIHLVCYNFMPVFDWTRTDLAMPLEDGSTALAYDSSIIDGIDASEMFDRIEKASGGFVMPGWEPNRRDEIMDLFEKYKDVDADKLRENYKYFLDGINLKLHSCISVCTIKLVMIQFNNITLLLRNLLRNLCKFTRTIRLGMYSDFHVL